MAQITFASVRNLATSSATERDFLAGLPLRRLDHLQHGQARRRVHPRSAGVTVWIGFLRAFMMLGRLA